MARGGAGARLGVGHPVLAKTAGPPRSRVYRRGGFGNGVGVAFPVSGRDDWDSIWGNTPGPARNSPAAIVLGEPATFVPAGRHYRPAGGHRITVVSGRSGRDD